MFKPTAEIIADSVNQSGDRLTTFVLTFHRFILPEFNTHRIFSRNASSSRAIPVEKMIKLVEDSQVEPIYWGANCKGMSAKEELGSGALLAAQQIWGIARESAIASAKAMVKVGAHKQIVNRLLEPFAPITVICTGTEYQNFFNQRCHPDAQPEIQALAIAMRGAYDMSEPTLIHCNEAIPWHIPFLRQDDWELWHENEITYQDLIKAAVGRCARASYLNHNGDRNIKDDIALHDRLLSSEPKHLSPFEHCAIALSNSETKANLTGWQSYRKSLEQNNDDS